MNIAAIVTTYFAGSHADVLLSRWLRNIPGDSNWGWNGPRTKLISLHVEQYGSQGMEDISRQTAAGHNLPMFQTVRETLTLGGDQLAADAVLLIGEHGDYPENEIGQKLYPRKELFDQIVAVYREFGRALPMFCDKHLSWNFEWAKEMVETSRRMGFVLVGGSSIPLARKKPVPPAFEGRPLEELVSVVWSGHDIYGFHSMEWAQSIVESRPGGESGIRSITAYKGDQAAEAPANEAWSSELMDKAMGAAEGLKEGDWRENCRGEKDAPAAWVMEYEDGLKVTHLNLSGHLAGFAAVGRIKGVNAPFVTVPILGDESNHHAHFATLSRMIEDAFLSGRPSFPLERTLLTTGATEAMLKSIAKPGIRMMTPHLKIAYGVR